jgi:5-methylcytosine-specific restriction endonuclease McrA
MDRHRIDGTRLVTRRSTRDQILLAWDYRCAYCGEELGGKPTIDHVVPKARGGLTVPSNLVACCMACNASKGHHPWREWLRQQPFGSALGEWAIRQWLLIR